MSFILTQMSGFGGYTLPTSPFAFPTDWTIVNNFDHSNMTLDATVYTGSLPSGVTISSTFGGPVRSWLSRTGFGLGNSFRYQTTVEAGGGSNQSLYHTWYNWTPAYLTSVNMRPVGRVISYPLFPELGTPSKYTSATTLGLMWRANTSSGNALWLSIYKTVAAGDPTSQLGLFFTNIAAGKTPVVLIDITGYDTMNYTHKLEVWYSLTSPGGLKIIWDDAITTWYLGDFAAVQTNLSDFQVNSAANDTANSSNLQYFGGLGGAITYKPA